MLYQFFQNREINLLEIGPYIDYLTKKQGVKNIFGKFTSKLFLFLFVIVCALSLYDIAGLIC